MQTEQLRTLAAFELALWADPIRSDSTGLETLGAVAVLRLPAEALVERTAVALLNRANREGSAATATGLGDPFYHLSCEERVVLSALHRGKWSYERIGRLIAKSRDEVAQMAWVSRLDLAFRPGQANPLLNPIGTDHDAIQCPEYDPRQPWTQSLLDEQLGMREKMFIQEHVLVCTRCAQTLERCRRLYYRVESLLPKVDLLEQRVASMREVLRQGLILVDPSVMTIRESLAIFFARPETKRWVLVAGVIFSFAIWWR